MTVRGASKRVEMRYFLQQKERNEFNITERIESLPTTTILKVCNRCGREVISHPCLYGDYHVYNEDCPFFKYVDKYSNKEQKERMRGG